MKKVKMMLLSLLVLAVVGGTLAFKAKFNRTFCFTDSTQNGAGEWVCPENPVCAELINSTTQGGFGNAITSCVSLKPLGGNCNDVGCPIIRTLKRDFQ